MSVADSDIKFRYSGGAANTDPLASLGGAISTAAGGVIDDNVLHDLFDAVSSAEEAAGDTEYRGIYVKNEHATLELQNFVLWLGAASELSIAKADENVNTTIETIANESTAPVGPTFSQPTTQGAGLAPNGATGLTAGSYMGYWVKRVIAAAAAAGQRSIALNYGGDTL